MPSRSPQPDTAFKYQRLLHKMRCPFFGSVVAIFIGQTVTWHDVGAETFPVQFPAQQAISQTGTVTGVMGSRATTPMYLPPGRRSVKTTADIIIPPQSLFTFERMTALAEPLPNDPYATVQWNFMAPDQFAGAANLFNPPTHNGNQSQVVVAIVDSGLLLNHEDYTTLAGYDFVHDPTTGNDGDGRDSDPTDPGDWVSETDISSTLVASNCQITTSKWHGTAIAGIIGAHSENQIGVAGGASNVSLLPVRVTGKCGGYVNDLIDGIRWAAGLSVAGAPQNKTPARVINLSVGFPGSCSVRLQSAIDDAVEAGAILVTAATNNPVSLDQTPYSPASCKNILPIAAALRNGLLAHYSASGNNVFLLGPGGSANDGIVSTDNGGAEHAIEKGDYGYHFGTSLAAAHVSAALATLLSIDPSLNNPALKDLLSNSATTTADDSQCQKNNCGYGKLNTNRAVRLLLNPDLAMTSINNDFVAGGNIDNGEVPALAATRSVDSTSIGSMGISIFVAGLVLIIRRRVSF